MKICSVCNIDRDDSDFYKNRNRCKTCCKMRETHKTRIAKLENEINRLKEIEKEYNILQSSYKILKDDFLNLKKKINKDDENNDSDDILY